MCTCTWCWSIHLITTEVSEGKLKRSHLDSLCKQNFAKQQGKTIRNSLHFRIRTSECSPATFLKTTVPQCIRTKRNFFDQLGIERFKRPYTYKDCKSHSWWPVLVLQFCCQCCPCWFLFFFKIISWILFLFFFLNPWVFGMEKVEPNWWLLLGALGSKKWPNNRLDHITAAMCQLLWIFHCLRIDFQCDVD